MKKLIGAALGVTLLGGVFVAGIAFGKAHAGAKFITREEVKWEDVGGPKLATLTGDPKKGTYIGLMQIPGGFTSPVHAHTGAYEAVQIEGTSTHWAKGEDQAKAKKMTPGSYWSFPGKLMHTSACEKGKDCVILLMQKAKFDFIADKEAPKKDAPKDAPKKDAPKDAPKKM